MNKTFCLMLLLALVACAKKKDDTPATSLTAIEDVDRAKTAVTSLALFSSGNNNLALTSDAVWQGDNTWGTKNIYSTDGECVDDASPKAYMDNSLYSGCANSNFWDLMGLFRFSCAAMHNVTSVNGIPDVTARKDATLTSAIRTTCDIPADADIDLEVAVAATTATSVYQRKVTLYIGGSESYVYWIGKNGTKTNMQFQDKGVGTAKFVGFYNYDSDSEVTLFELQGRHEDNTPTAFFLRFHQDASTDVATALGTMGDVGAGNFVRWSFQGFSGDPSSSTSPISVNMQWDNNAATGTLSTCINPQTQVASGTTIECGTYEAPAAISTINTFLSTTTDTLRGLTDEELLAKTTETSTINFTAANIETAAIK